MDGVVNLVTLVNVPLHSWPDLPPVRPRFLDAYLSTRAHYECAIVTIEVLLLAFRPVGSILASYVSRASRL
jgi:hypothetical protein